LALAEKRDFKQPWPVIIPLLSLDSFLDYSLSMGNGGTSVLQSWSSTTFTRMSFGYLLCYGINSTAGKSGIECLFTKLKALNRFTAALATNFTYSIFFNTIFSVVPTVGLGTFDQDINDELSMQIPQLFRKGIEQRLYNTDRFFGRLCDALYQSLLLYMAGQWMFEDTVVDARGWDYDNESMGTVIAFAAIFVVNFHCLLNWNHWTWITAGALAVSFVSWLLYVILYATNVAGTTYGLHVVLFTSPNFYIGVVWMIIASLLPRYTYKFTQQYLWPNDTDIIQEYQKFEWTKGQPANANISFGNVGFTSQDHLMAKGPPCWADGVVPEETASPLDVSTSSFKNTQTDSASDGFGIVPGTVTPAQSQGLSVDTGTQESRRRQPSFSKAFKSGVSKASQFVKKLGKSPFPSNLSLSKSAGGGGGFNSRLVFMGAPEHTVPNTGFAFSQDSGTGKLIAPRSMYVLYE
jgi:Phospholipid-translocating P-type ATPase C-terminal